MACISHYIQRYNLNSVLEAAVVTEQVLMTRIRKVLFVEDSTWQKDLKS